MPSGTERAFTVVGTVEYLHLVKAPAEGVASDILSGTLVPGMLVDSEIDLSTRNGNVMVFINSRYLNVIKSGAHQQDCYQLRPLINMVDSW